MIGEKMKDAGIKNMTVDDRIKIESLLRKGVRKNEIAIILKRSLSTIYNEINRGTVDGEYNAFYSQQLYEKSMKCKGKKPVLLINEDLANRIADMILNDSMSPEQIYQKMKSEYRECPSKSTIYNAIYNGLIPNVSKSDLNKKVTNIFSHGLVQLPAWIRCELNLEDGDSLRIQVKDGKIIFEPIGEK